MLRKTVGVAVAACAFGLPRPVAGQVNVGGGTIPTITFQTAITFTLQVNLTQLSPDLAKVGFTCLIMPGETLAYPSYLSFGGALFGGGFPFASWPFPKDELPVMSGQVQGTLRVVYPLAAEWFNNPIGKTADYQCMLLGYVTSVAGWGVLSEDSKVPALLVRVPTGSLAGSFFW